MMLFEPDKARARIHMGVPVLGVQDSGFALGYRFTSVMGLLEYRMNQLQPHEYAKITGTPTAAFALYGNVSVGATLSATFTGSAPVTYTVVPSDLQAPDPVLSVATNFSNLVNQTIGASYIASAQPSVVWPVTTIGAGPKVWQVAIVPTPTATPATVGFTISTATTGQLVSYVVLQGALPSPRQTFAEDKVTAVGYLSMCDYLESKTASSSDLLKFSVAKTVTFRADELNARSNVYEYWRERLGAVFGIPLYPMSSSGGFGGSNTGLSI